MPPKAGALFYGCHENVQPELVSQQAQPAIPGDSEKQFWTHPSQEATLLTLGIW